MPASDEIRPRTTYAEPPVDVHWGATMVIGILLIVGGIFALSAAALTSLISVTFLGIVLMSVGILEIFGAFRIRRTEPFLHYFLAGLLALVVGALFISRPAGSLVSLNFLVAGYLFATGLFLGVTAIADRYPRWGWDLAYSIVAIALGAYLFKSWSTSSLMLLGTLVGIEIIARGMRLVAASWVLRDIKHGRLAGGLGAA